MSVVLLVIGLVMFVGLVIVHEFGHFILARRNGVDVEEFGLGFPPRALSKKMPSGYILSLNWLPLGGFVRLRGEHDSDVGKGSFGAATLWVKTKIIAAGVGMNLLAAFVLLTILAVVGMPQVINNQFNIKSDSKTIKQEVLAGYIEPNSPASSIGLKSQDQLTSLTNNKGVVESINNPNNLPSITKKNAGDEVTIGYYASGKYYSKKVKLRTNAVVQASLKTNNPLGYLGLEPSQYVVKQSTWSAPIVAVGLMKQMTVLTLKGIGNAIMGLVHGNTTKATSQISGPVGIVVLLKDGSLLGYQFVLLIVAVISLSLAIINILPIPALDGGRLFFTLIPRLFLKRPLTKKTEEIIHGSGMAALLTIFVLITIVDVKRYF
ncbi:MAG TPA: M50 family metallopeptidase [Candidatus Saccharimonadia bacterium]|nr:M50 family metallopeptidase [Candidatus Saccharimonadia bacterium]